MDARADGTADPEQVLTLLQLAVAQICLGPFQFLGRSIDALWYWSLLNDMGLPQDDPIRALLTLLARRGYIVGYQWVLGTDGIHGWLNPRETADLTERLFTLPLPNYDQSFAAMSQFKQVVNVLEKYPTLPPFHSFAHSHPTASFAELSLSFVRTVCRIASREGKGVLWGNDIYPDL